MTKPKLHPNTQIDLSTLYITDEPFSESHPVQGSKYDEIFSKLPKNQRLVCATGQAARISQGLRKWLEKRGHEAAVVRAKERCDDGKGGVWWLDGERAERPSHAKPAKPAERPSRVKTTFASAAPGSAAPASAAPGSPFAILDKKRKP